MATGQGLICKLPHHIAIEGADKIVKCIIAGETVITQKSNQPGTLGILFDMESQLSHEMCHFNNLYTNAELNADKTAKQYVSENRRIRPVKLRGVKCSAFWMPIDSLEWAAPLEKLNFKEGEEIEVVNGKPVCARYVTPNQRAMNTGKGQQPKKVVVSVPTFKEHIDTSQWGRNSHRIKEGDYLIFTEKNHGTSSRVGRLPAVKKLNRWERFISSLLYYLLNGELKDVDTKTETEYVIGSRRVVKRIGEKEHTGGGFYKQDIWSLSAERFKGRLHKGETIYYEIVGYMPDGGTIMPSHDNQKLKKFMKKDEYKEFIQRYGDVTHFTYNCSKPYVTETGIIYDDANPYYETYVYRITMTNEDGVQVDLNWEQVKGRCEELNVKHVPELTKGIVYKSDKDDKLYIRTESYIAADPVELVENMTNAHSTIFPSHIREGICIRVEGKDYNPVIYKNKSYLFKVLEGIVKENDSYVDLEETN